MNKVFIDCNIIIDLFAQRVPYYNSAAELFTLIDENKSKGFTSPLIIANTHYILRKHQPHKTCLQNLRKLRLLLTILPINAKIIDLALAENKLKDFEDAVHYYTAKLNHIQFIITRNKKDYKVSNLTVLTAEEYMAYHH